MKQLASIIGALALAALMIVGRPSTISAHSEYDHSEPADGATVATAPTSVKVVFTEELQFSGGASSLRVNNAAGQQVDNKDTKLDPSDKDHKTMVVTLPTSLPAGTYKVLWKTTSADDGDADDGDFSFTIRGAAAAASPVSAAPAASPAAAPAAQAAPAAKPAGQPSPVPAQAPRGLPNTGSADPDSWIVWAGLGGVLLVLSGAVLLRRARTA